ncbi:efflux RND transporter periplasmic adaptor subunit [Nocardioides sp.]|uniref:efflux RND transporter periplasmic adaptor subunit n=1 Tax=Nocardioides sp. TaxID=35761 RepID=UPI002616816D|nr:efflux RND transporter periplasmic adaptor subunit [Nocardioides sp.]
MRRLRSKWWWIGAAVVLVAAASVGGWLLLKPDDSSSSTTAATTATVTSETVKQTISASGTISPSSSADLDFSVSGTVTHVYVAEGDTVAKGQKLASVDSTSLVAARTAAAAQLSAAKTQLSTDIDDDASAVQIASDRASIVSAQDNYDSAVQSVSDATLKATISGTVTSVGIAKGDTVGSSSGGGSSASGGSSSGVSNTASTSSTTAVSIVSDGTWLVDATVASSDVDSVKKGMQAQLTVTGVSDTIYGTVKSVGMVAQTSSSGAAVFPVTIKVTGKRDDLFSGTSVTASIIVKQTDNVITVASRALKTSGDETYVTKVVDGKNVKQVVTVGETYGASTVITKGLSEGDKVVVPGFTRPTSSGSSGKSGSDSQMPDMSNMPSGGMPGGGGGMPSGGFPGGGQ